MNTDSPASQPELTESLQGQFGALQQLITDWLGRSPARSRSKDAELMDLANRITDLLGNFSEFFTDYHDYFNRRIDNKDIKTDKIIYVLREVNSKIQEQWATLSRLLAQRRHGSPYYHQLLRADAWAADLYKRFNGAKPDNVQPLVYFGKVYKIIRFPYLPVPLIAIPLVHWNASKEGEKQIPVDWLSLAHELGHFVFWNSANLDQYRQVQDRLKKAIDQRIRKHFNQHPGPAEPIIEAVIQTWQCWLEESFADIFGALVGGANYARNAQDRLVRDELNQPDDLLFDDGQHPMPAVRPLLSAEVLKYLDGDRGRAARDHWIALWGPRLDEAQVIFEQQAKEHPHDISVQPSPYQLAEMVPIIVAGLLTTPGLHRSGSKEPEPLHKLIEDIPWSAVELEKITFPDLPHQGESDQEKPNVPSNELPPLTTEPENTYRSKSFQQLRQYIQNEIWSGRESRPEWEAILDLEFSQFSKYDNIPKHYGPRYITHRTDEHDYYNFPHIHFSENRRNGTIYGVEVCFRQYTPQ